MKKLCVSLVLVLFIAGLAAAAGPVLSVKGPGLPGSIYTFTVTDNPDPNKVAFLALSPLPGKTEFPFITLDLAWPIFASGMGSLNSGSVSHKVTVPIDWPVFLTIPFYAQSVVVTPKGAGYQAVTTNVVKFMIRGK